MFTNSYILFTNLTQFYNFQAFTSFSQICATGSPSFSPAPASSSPALSSFRQFYTALRSFNSSHQFAVQQFARQLYEAPARFPSFTRFPELSPALTGASQLSPHLHSSQFSLGRSFPAIPSFHQISPALPTSHQFSQTLTSSFKLSPPPFRSLQISPSSP